MEDLKEVVLELFDCVKFFFFNKMLRSFKERRGKNKIFKNSFWYYFENSL